MSIYDIVPGCVPPSSNKFAHVGTLELKARIVKRLGPSPFGSDCSGASVRSVVTAAIVGQVLLRRLAGAGGLPRAGFCLFVGWRPATC